MSSNEVFNEGPTTSQHIEAQDDDHFNSTTFKLKRTRSMGLLDDFITQAHSQDSPNQNSNNDNNDQSCSNTKLTSRAFVSNETLNKLNIRPTVNDSESVPSFYTSVIPSSKSNKNKRVNNNISPASLQSEDLLSDDNYNSEDSLSSIGSSNNSVCLTPKHQLKKQQQQQQQQQQSPSATTTDSNDLELNSPSFIASRHLHDDIDVKYCPDQHVDYFSHDWDEAEILKSWRYVILKKNDFADAARLENASWRTWAQARNGLKTISPAELNWSKETDVSWLYGPLYKEEKNDFDIIDFSKKKSGSGLSSNNNSSHSNKSSNDKKYLKLTELGNNRFDSDEDLEMGEQQSSASSSCEQLKPILKKRTNVEKMISDASYSRLQILLEEHDHKFKGSPILETTSNNLNESPSPAISSTNQIPGEASPFLLSNNQTSDEINNVNMSQLSSLMTNSNNPTNSASISTPLTVKKERHIHFNMRVDQCIALDENHNNSTDYSTDYEYEEESDDGGPSRNIIHSSTYYDDMEYDNEYEDVDKDEDEDEDEEDGFILNTTVKSPMISHNPPIWSQASSRRQSINNKDNGNVTVEGKMIITIAPLPATTLKTCSDDEDEIDPYTVSHNTRTNRGYDYYYDYNTVYSNNSNPMIYSVINNQQEGVQMFDVPENCQIEDVMDIDGSHHQSPPPPSRQQQQQSTKSSVIPQMYDVPSGLATDIPFEIQKQLNNNSNDTHDVPMDLQYDLPESIMHDIPLEAQNQMFSANGPACNATSLANSSTSNNNSDGANTPEGSGIKRTTSMLGNSSSTLGSGTSLSTIKVGISGLDLSSSGLRRSTGAGSKPQLYSLGYQLQHDDAKLINNPLSRSASGVSLNNAGAKKSFMFNNSSDDDNSEDEEDDEDGSSQDEMMINTPRPRPIVSQQQQQTTSTFKKPSIMNASSMPVVKTTNETITSPQQQSQQNSNQQQQQYQQQSHEGSNDSYASLSSIASNGYRVSNNTNANANNDDEGSAGGSGNKLNVAMKGAKGFANQFLSSKNWI